MSSELGNLSLCPSSPSINNELLGWDLVRTGQLEQIRMRLIPDGKINPLRRGVFGENMLLYALLRNQTDIAKFLMDSRFNRNLIAGTYGPKPGEDLSRMLPEELEALMEYDGENCIHLALANHDISALRHILKVVKFLDPEGKDLLPKVLHQKVTGRFFRGEHSDCVYLGQTPLHFAVCTHQPKAVSLLLSAAMNINQKSCDPDDAGIVLGSMRIMNDKDMYGNTCFHLAVLYGEAVLWDIMMNHLVKCLIEENGGSEHETDQQKIFRASSWLRKQKNIAMMTPIQFCVYLNNVNLFEHIIISCRLSLWDWGDRAFNAYNLAEIDWYNDLDLDRFEGVDVLTLVLTEAHLEFTRLPFINNILEDKWVKYGRKGVYFLLLLQVVFCIAMALLFKRIYPDFYNLDQEWGKAAIHGAWPVFLSVLVFSKALIEIVIEILELKGLIKIYGVAFGLKIFHEKSLESSSWLLNCFGFIIRLLACDRTKSFEGNRQVQFLANMNRYGDGCNEKLFPSTTGFFRNLRFFSNSIILAIIVVLLIGFGNEGHKSRRNARSFAFLLILTLLFEWVQIFMYMQNIQMISRFVASIVAMLINDVMGFICVLVVILLAFSCAVSIVLGSEWNNAIFPVFELGVGSGDFFSDFRDENLDDELDPYKRYYTYFLFIAYVVIMILLMLNLLIAVMSETAINMLGETFEYRQRIMRASTIMLVERRRMTLRYYIDKFLYLFSCEKYSTGQETGCCIFPAEDPWNHEHPWTGFLYQRTGLPGWEICKSINFENELANELSRSYTFNVLDPRDAPVEKDDVIVEDNNFEDVAVKFEKEIDKCNDLLKVKERVRVIQERLHHRILDTVYLNSAVVLKTGLLPGEVSERSTRINNVS